MDTSPLIATGSKKRPVRGQSYLMKAKELSDLLTPVYKSTCDLTVVKSSLSVVVNCSSHAAIIFSLASGMLSINVCVGVFP